MGLNQVLKTAMVLLLCSASVSHAKFGNKDIYVGKVVVTSEIPQARTREEAFRMLFEADRKMAGFGRQSGYVGLLGYKFTEITPGIIRREFIAMSTMKTDVASEVLSSVFVEISAADERLRYVGSQNAAAFRFSSDGYKLDIEARDYLSNEIMPYTESGERSLLRATLHFNFLMSDIVISLDEAQTKELLKLRPDPRAFDRIKSCLSHLVVGK